MRAPGIKEMLALCGSGSTSDGVNLCKFHKPERDMEIIYFTDSFIPFTSHSITTHGTDILRSKRQRDLLLMIQQRPASHK